MPRKRVVSRTITTTKADVLVVDKKTKRTKTITVSVAGSYPPDRFGMKRLEKKVEKLLLEDYKMAMVEKQEVVKAVYSMPEEDFLEHATIQNKNNETKNKEKKGKKKQ